MFRIAITLIILILAGIAWWWITANRKPAANQVEAAYTALPAPKGV